MFRFNKSIAYLKGVGGVNFVHESIAFVLFWHQQHGFCFVPMSTMWLSKLTTAGKAKRGCVNLHTPRSGSHQSSLNKSISQWLSDWQHKATIGLGPDKNINDWKEQQLKSTWIQKSHLTTALFGLFQVVWFPSKVLWAPTSLFGKRIWPIMWWQLDKRSLEYRVWISKDCGNLPTWLEVPSLNK